MVSEPSKRKLLDEIDSDFEQDDRCEALVGSPLSHSSSDSGCFNMARKKRRGLIEKRRRDRINRSLNDLKHLVPTAHERQASAKLEKSEVLALAVDHIKSLTAKLERANPHNLAIDYRTIGYQECIGETISYLMHGEGLAPTSQLHTRLISHLRQQLAAHNQSVVNSCITPESYPAACQSMTYADSSSAVCKPEPPISPSYQGTAPLPPAQCVNYPQYNASCLRSSIPATSEGQGHWQSPANFPTDPSVSLSNYAPQTSWV